MTNSYQFLKLAFISALTRINSWNYRKYEHSHYIPLMIAKISIISRKDEEGKVIFDIEITNCVIYGLSQTFKLLKVGKEYKSCIERDFESLGDAEEYFRQILQNKCFDKEKKENAVA